MKIIKINAGGIVFDNGTKIEDFHAQDCCEYVWADWEQLNDTDVLSHDFPEELKIEGVEDSGFRLDGYFIPCYNENNGYYSNSLELEIKYPDKKKIVIDITEFVEDQEG